MNIVAHKCVCASTRVLIPWMDIFVSRGIGEGFSRKCFIFMEILLSIIIQRVCFIAFNDMYVGAYLYILFIYNCVIIALGLTGHDVCRKPIYGFSLISIEENPRE